MKKILLYSLISLTAISVHGQTWQWAKRGGSAVTPSSFHKEKVISMCVDPKGNVSVASQIGSQLIDIDGVPKTGYSIAFDTPEIAIASFSCNGAYRWSKIIGTSGQNDRIQDVGTDAQGNVYAAGQTDAGYTLTSGAPRLVHFDTDTILPAVNELINQYKKTMFLIKYDSIGTFKWLRMPQPEDVSLVASGSQYSSQNLQVDAAGNCFWMVRLPAGIHAGGSYVVTSAGVTNHILKYNSQGNFIGGHPVAFNAQQTGNYRMIRNHQNGNYYIAGFYNNLTGETYTIGGQPLTKSLFVAAFDSTGAFLWTRTNDGPDPYGNPDNYDVAVDDNNDVYFTGSALYSNPLSDFPNVVIDGWNGQPFTPPAQFNGKFMFIVKMDVLGNTLWQTNSNRGQANAITVKGNEVAITGASWSFIWQNLNFVYPNNGQGGQTPFIIRFNKTTGALVGHNYLLSPSVNLSTGTRILSDNLGNYLVGGDVAYQLTGFGNTITNVGGSSDFFVAKWGTNSCNFLRTSSFEQKNIKLYPNPVQDRFYTNSDETQNYMIYSVLGSKVKQGSLTVGNSIDCSELTAGVYIIQLTNPLGKQSSLKFVKE